MSAAKWRRAMATGAAAPTVALPAHLQLVAAAPYEARERSNLPLTLRRWFNNLSPWQIVVLAGLLVFPFVVSRSSRFRSRADARARAYRAIADVSCGYGGMVSLAQMTSPASPLFGRNSVRAAPPNQPQLAVVAGRTLCSADRYRCAAAIAWLSVRTEGIYTIMITLPGHRRRFLILVLQNYSLFNCCRACKSSPSDRARKSTGAIRAVLLSDPGLGASELRVISYLVRSPFGVALQASANPRRMESLGFNSSHTASQRMSSQASSPRSAACSSCWYNA